MGSSLLRDWGLLQDQVIPPLLGLGSSPARVWSVGDPSDAVAVTAAFADAKGAGGRHIRTYMSGSLSDSVTVSFGAADIGCLPLASRSAWFQRQRHRWVPKAAIAERIVLAVPSEAVDLMTVRSASGLDARAVSRLRLGGYLLLIDRSPAEGSSCTARLVGMEAATRPAWMRPIDGEGRLFRKVGGHRDARMEGGPWFARPGGPPAAREHESFTLADRQRQEELVLCHVDLAKSLARRFANRGPALEDLEAVTLLALVKAAGRFDPTRGSAFAAYATASALGEIKRYFRDKTWAVRVPRSLQELNLALKDAREELSQELGTSPTIGQVAARLGVTEEAVLEAMEAGSSYRADPLDVGDGDDEHSRDLPVFDPAFGRVLDRQQLVAVLPRLAQRERLILKGLYLDGRTQEDVAAELGISQMQVSRLLARARATLRG